MSSPHGLEDGSLFIRNRLTIPSDEIVLRVTTSGGPGGQHANRSLTRVVASFDVRESQVLSNADRELLLENLDRSFARAPVDSARRDRIAVPRSNSWPRRSPLR